MKSWVDKTAEQDNVWLVLVFHGIDGTDGSPKPLWSWKDYFGYINSKTGSLWVATFRDVSTFASHHATVHLSKMAMPFHAAQRSYGWS
jgi:hypothetical protein